MGKVLEIVQLGDPILRKVCNEVNLPLAPDMRDLADDMLATLAASKGVGLAAPQVGKAVRMIVISSRSRPQNPDAPEIEPFFCINPKLISHAAGADLAWEGCLSIPGLRAPVLRPAEVQVRYQRLDGETVECEISGFLARVFQHEYDHLHGVLYLDRLEDNSQLMSEREYMRRIVGKES